MCGEIWTSGSSNTVKLITSGVIVMNRVEVVIVTFGVLAWIVIAVGVVVYG
jgi:hypothetical protein